MSTNDRKMQILGVINFKRSTWGFLLFKSLIYLPKTETILNYVYPLWRRVTKQTVENLKKVIP